MTFEKALEAMRRGEVVEREEWDGKCRICMYHNAIYTFPFLRDFPNLRTFDITAPDWQIYEPEKKVEPDAFKNLRCDIKPMSYAEWKEAHIDAREYKKRIAELEAENADLKERLAKPEIKTGRDLWFVKANQHTEEYAKQIKEKLFEAYKLEPHKEGTTMYTDLEITFKSGETITYSEGEWDDYSYDGKSVAVKKSGAWVGLYNFDNVFCVELKSRED